MKISDKARRQMVELETKETLINLLSITQLDYNLLQFELGMQFLQNIFPEGDPAYTEYFKFHSCQKMYWKWFRNVWHLWQQDMVQFYNLHKKTFTYPDFVADMEDMIRHKNTHHSFNNYLKIANHKI